MSDWTPWQVVALVGIAAAAAVGLAWLAAWYALARRRGELADAGPDERAARALGEAVARCDGAITTGTVGELFRVFDRATGAQKRAIVAAIRGLLAAARDGPANLTDLDGRLLAVARRLAGVPAHTAPAREDDPGPGLATAELSAAADRGGV
jgi:hypothetical protein